MKELTKLKALSEDSKDDVELRSAMRRGRRNYIGQLEKAADEMDSLFTGPALPRLLEQGKFPSTESKAMLSAWKKFSNELDDFKMALLQEFDK